MKSTGDTTSQRRLLNQRIASGLRESPADVVAAMGAMQAQDFSAALWAIGLRTAGATRQSVEQAIAERKIVRTWPMRGTLHFVAANDVRWMLQLLTPRILAGTARRIHALELDAAVFARCREVFLRTLQGGACVTREAMLEQLEQDGISTAGGRGYHILFRLAQEGLICFGPRSGKAHTFVLLDEWIPRSRTLDRDAALAELARRYFTSHGPATLQDFVWWSGLTAADARAGIALAKLDATPIAGTPHWGPESTAPAAPSSSPAQLLPSFDEYLLGYKDRAAVLDAAHGSKVNPGNNGVFMHTVLMRGRVCATWKQVLRKNAVTITVHPFAPFQKSDQNALLSPARRYAQFLGVESAHLDI